MPKAKKQVVADSWDDEDLSDDGGPGDTAPEPATQHSPSPASASKASPTTAAPSHPGIQDWDTGSSGPDARNNPEDASPDRRPEKTDAVARRMIVAGLGLKAPKLTDEQKAYQKSIKEQEKKRKEQERAEEQRRREMTEKAKAAIWDD